MVKNILQENKLLKEIIKQVWSVCTFEDFERLQLTDEQKKLILFIIMEKA